MQQRAGSKDESQKNEIFDIGKTIDNKVRRSFEPSPDTVAAENLNDTTNRKNIYQSSVDIKTAATSSSFNKKDKLSSEMTTGGSLSTKGITSTLPLLKSVQLQNHHTKGDQHQISKHIPKMPIPDTIHYHGSENNISYDLSTSQK